jgi:hypothetical protein
MAQKPPNAERLAEAFFIPGIDEGHGILWIPSPHRLLDLLGILFFEDGRISVAAFLRNPP